MDISAAFNSKTHFRILEVLALRTHPCHLRSITSMTSQYVHSVENALQDLCKKRVLLREKKGRLILFKLNDKHPAVATIRKIFQVVQDEKNKEQSRELGKRAQSLVLFIDSSLMLFKKVKK